MASVHPAPGYLERDAEAMWAAISATSRKVLHLAAVASSSVAVVGLTGYGNGLYLVDRDGGRRDRDALFDFCNREVAQTRACDAIPYFLPYLNGRLDQPEARGSFIGLA